MNHNYILVGLFLLLMLGSYYFSGLISEGYERGILWGVIHFGSFAICYKYIRVRKFAKNTGDEE